MVTSAHGLPRLLKTEKKLVKTVYLICLLASTCLAAYYLQKILFDYITYDIGTAVDLKTEEETIFPTISFCTSNKEQWHTSLDKMIMTCSFDRDEGCKNLSAIYFETFDDPFFGECYRFNSGKNGLLKSFIPGLNHGFILTLNVPFVKYFFLSIHNHTAYPLNLEDSAYRLSTGQNNFFEIVRTCRKKLNQPYNNCIKDTKTYNGNKKIIEYLENMFHISYRYRDCITLCRIFYFLENNNCGCNSSPLLYKKDCIFSQFTDDDMNNEVKKCMHNFIKNQKKIYCSPYCPSRCETYQLLINTYNQEVNSLDQIPMAARFENISDLKQHYIGIFVYYTDLEYTEIKQHPKSEPITLVSSIGGVLSLCIGISLISLVEVIEILIEVFYALIKKND